MTLLTGPDGLAAREGVKNPRFYVDGELIDPEKEQLYVLAMGFMGGMHRPLVVRGDMMPRMMWLFEIHKLKDGVTEYHFCKEHRESKRKNGRTKDV